jgi:hypothetical protein
VFKISIPNSRNVSGFGTETYRQNNKFIFLCMCPVRKTHGVTVPVPVPVPVPGYMWNVEATKLF